MSNCYEKIFNNNKVKEDYNYVPIPKDNSLSISDLKHIDVSSIQNKGMYTLFKSDYLGNKFDTFKYKATELIDDDFKNNDLSGIEVVDDVGSLMYLVNEKVAKIPNIKSIDDIYHTTHELTHLILNSNIHNNFRDNIFNEIQHIGKFINNNNKFDISIKGKTINGKEISIKLSDMYTIGSIDEYTKEELVTTFLSTLITGDFIKANKYILAKIFSKDNKSIVDLEGNIKGFEFEGINNKEYLTTIKQLKDLLTEYGDYANYNNIKKLTSYMYSIYNSSNEIKELFFGKPKNIDKDSIGYDLFDNIDNRLNSLKNATYKLHHNFFNGINISDIIGISKKETIMRKALALAKGSKSNILEHTKINKDIMSNYIKDIDLTDNDEIDNSLGHMSIFGFHFLNNDITNISNSLKNKLSNIIFKSMKILNTKNIQKILDLEPTEAKVRLEKIEQEYLGKIETIFNKDIRNLFDNLINKSSNGDISSFNILVKKINNMLEEQKNSLSVEDSKIIAKKLVSLRSIINNIDNEYFSNIFKKFNSYYKNNSNKINNIFSVFKTNINKETIFGENIELNFLENSKNLKITDNIEGIDKDNLLAKIKVNDKDYYAFVGDRLSTTIGFQDSLTIPFDLKEFEKGIYEKNIDGVNITFNAQNIKLKRDFIDKKISTQFGRNSYIQAKKEISKDLGYRQWKILRDNNILLTKNEVKQIENNFPEQKNNFMKLDINNPLVKISGNQWYINKRYEHQLLGTQGVDIKHMYSTIMNDKTAKNLAIFTKSILDFIRESSKALLFISPRIQLNNFMTSFAIYVSHSKYKGLFFKKYYNKAKINYYNYKNIMQKLITIKLQLEIEKEPISITILKQQEKDLQNELDNNPLSYAFEHGFTDTLRNTALQLNSVEDLTLYQFIKNKFGKNKSNSLKTLMLNENTKLGKKLGDLFEHSELFPKLALYLERKEHLSNDNEALMYTLNSFPVYDNLSFISSMFDQISPYTKFFLNIPRITAWAFVTHPKRFASFYAISAMLPSVMDNNQQNNWYEENGYIDIGDIGSNDIYLSQTSLDPVLHPLQVFSYKPFIWDIPAWAIKSYNNATGNAEDISKFLLPINIGK